MEFIAPLIIVLLCLAAEGFFSGSEIALISADRAKMRASAERGSVSASMVERMIEKPERLLGVTLMGTNLCTITGASLVAVVMLKLFGAMGEFYALLVFYPLTLIFGEVLPKTVYQRDAERIAPLVIWPLKVIFYIMFPVVYLLSSFARVVAAAMDRKGEGRSPFVTKEELELIASKEDEEVEIKAEERKMISNIFELGELKAKNIMVPLIDVVAVEDTNVVEAAIKKIDEHGYSRLPVYRDKIYNIIGVVNAFDILSAPAAETIIAPLVRQAYYVPENKKVDALFKELQLLGRQIAIVVDEYGAAVGIVTIEDIIEEIFGEIHDEYDRVAEQYKRLPDGSYLIDARMEIEAANERLGLAIPQGDYETFGGFITNIVERIPKKGEVFIVGDYKLSIEESTDRSITKVRAQRVAPPLLKDAKL